MPEILIGWKEISIYLQVTEKTAIHYHKNKGLPIKKDPAGHPIIAKEKVDLWRFSHSTS